MLPKPPMASDADLPPLPRVPAGLYRHYKGGLYEVLDIARHSETLEPLVVYRALYGAHGLWVRPVGAACGDVHRNSGDRRRAPAALHGPGGFE